MRQKDGYKDITETIKVQDSASHRCHKGLSPFHFMITVKTYASTIYLRTDSPGQLVCGWHLNTLWEEKIPHTARSVHTAEKT